MMLLTLALAPVIIILFYVYFRDKYEKEPVAILLKCFLSGAVALFPILVLEYLLEGGWKSFGFTTQGLAYAAYKSFLVAGFSEEIFKFAALAFLIWMRREFNERFDGIVYAVFVSLGFAAVENMAYVFGGGPKVGLARMFTAVPAHAVFGIAMGYYFGLAKFIADNRRLYLSLAVWVPMALHGFYDFILFSKLKLLLLLFVPYLLVLFRQCEVFMKAHSENSEFALGSGSAEWAPSSGEEHL